MEKEQTLSTGGHKLHTRIVAGSLAALMITSFGISQMGSIKISRMAYGETGSAANQYLVDNTDYIKKDVVHRAVDSLAGAMFTPETLEEHYMLAEVQIGKGNYFEALREIEACIDTKEANTVIQADLWLKKGCLQALLNRNDDALESLDEALSLSDNLSQAYLVKAQIYILKEDAQHGAESLQAYLDTNPSDFGVWAVLAEVYTSLSEFEKAESCYTALLDRPKLTDDELEFYIKRAGCRLILEDAAAAEKDIDAYLAAKINPGPDADFMAGLCQANLQNYSDAIDRFEKAIDSGYSPPGGCYEQLAQCYFVLGNYQKVLEWGTLGQQNREGVIQYGPMVRQMGISAMSLGRIEEASAYFTQVMAETGTAGVDAYYRGVCTMALQQYQQAVADFSNSIAAGEMVQQSYYNRGICHLQLEEGEAAAQDFAKTLTTGVDKALIDSAQQLLGVLGTMSKKLEG